MKKTLPLAALLAMIFLPVSYASIIITSPDQAEFNRGDRIPLEGFISEPTGISGFLQLSAICDGNLAELWQFTPVTLVANEQKSFPGQISIPALFVTGNMDGDCYLKAELFTQKTGSPFDSASSSHFKVLPSALRGSFAVAEPMVQLGENLVLTGTIQRLDGTPFNGRAYVYFVQGTKKYNINSFTVENGELRVDYNPKNLPLGEYNIEVSVSDADQNKQTFDASTFVLTSQLNVYVETDKYEYLPGEKVKISGDVTNMHQEKNRISSASLSFDGKELEASVKGSAFSYSLVLPKDVKSGKHSVIAVVKDGAGNSGYALKEIIINPVPTRLENKIPDVPYKPKDTVIVTTSLYDQAGDLMDNLVTATISDAKRNIIFSSAVQSGKAYSVELPAYAVPGKWKVKAQSGKLVEEGTFNVEPVLDMMASITGHALAITNLGNVKGEKDISMVMKGENGVFDFKASGDIKPGETKLIDFNKKVTSGAYDMIVGLPDGQREFDVIVTGGKSIASINLFFALMVLCAVGLLVFMSKSMHGKVKKMNYRVSDDDMAKISRTATERYEAKIAPEKEKYAELEDFKKRTFEEIRKTEQQASQKSSLNSWRDTYYKERPWRKQPEDKKNDDGMSSAAGFFGGF